MSDFLHLPMMSLDLRKPITVRLEPELAAQAEDRARELERKAGPFCAWCVRQVLRLEFLSPENREFLGGILREVGRPWGPLDLVDGIISIFRKEVRAGRLRPLFWSGQVSNQAKAGPR